MGLKTALDQAEKNPALKIWPNPAGDQLNISFDAPQNEAVVRITDLGGQELYNRKLKNNSITLDVGNYPPAMYIVHITGGVKNETGYFIKE